MPRNTLTVALISEVFPAQSDEDRLCARLSEAKAAGADLAVLPELPLNPWSPATKNARDEDAEPPHGPRHEIQSRCAKKVGIALVGGAVVRNPDTGVRRNTALILDAQGELVGTYCKLHLPEEPGFWETSHYEPGVESPTPFDHLDFPFGVQLCSDINRPQGCQLLGAGGALAVVAPRATELATCHRWRPVYIANALTSAMYVLSVNRPAPEQDVLIGGPSIAVAPTGEVILESTDPVSVVTLKREVVEKARIDYPGYLPVRSDLYAQAWASLAKK